MNDIIIISNDKVQKFMENCLLIIMNTINIIDIIQSKFNIYFIRENLLKKKICHPVVGHQTKVGI